MIDRQAKKLDIPIVEGWAIPYMNVRVLKKLSIEDAYGIKFGPKISEATEEEIKNAQMAVLSYLSNLGGAENIQKFYSKESIKNLIETGRTPSFCPLVWLTASIMALETIKVLLNWGTIATDCDFKLYDPFEYKTIWNW
jgi:hypothetical protein